MRPSRRAPALPASTAWNRRSSSEREGSLWAISDGAPTPIGELVPSRSWTASCRALHFSKSMRWDGSRFSRPRALAGLQAGRGGRARDRLRPDRRRPLAGTAGGRRRRRGGLRRELPGRCLARCRRWPTPASGAGASRRGWTRSPAGPIRWPSWRRWSTWSSGRRCSTAGSTSVFLALPERVVITAMQSHQRYFPVRPAVGWSRGSCSWQTAATRRR